MNLIWHGMSCFEMVSKTPDSEVHIVTDPYDSSTGLRFPRTLEADIVTVSHNASDANNVVGIHGNPFVIKTPGEYEVKGAFVFAINAPDKEKMLITRFEVESLHLVHLGALTRELTSAELEQLPNTDILMIPVGGERVMNPQIAATVIAQIEPRIILPMTYGIENVKEKLGRVDIFCKELAGCRREDVNKLKLTRKDLPEEDQVIMVLSR